MSGEGDPVNKNETVRSVFFTNSDKWSKIRDRKNCLKGANGTMEEKRKDRRMSLSAKLLIKNMNDDSVKAEEVEIEVLDVSKTGVGFICNTPLSIGAVYEAHLRIWTDETIHAFLKVVRIEQTKEERYICGTIFMGLPEVNAKRIEIYEMIDRINEK